MRARATGPFFLLFRESAEVITIHSGFAALTTGRKEGGDDASTMRARGYFGLLVSVSNPHFAHPVVLLYLYTSKFNRDL